jgi:carbon-monoxide dehydrogenase medium subunit
MTRRHNDFAVISVACVADRDDDGGFTNVRIGLGGVNDTPVLATGAGELLGGTRLSDDDIAHAGIAAVEAVDPPTDIRATSDYRTHLVPIYVRRVLRKLRAAPSGTLRPGEDQS